MEALRENIAGVLLLHDNAPAHKPRSSRATIRKCGFVELNHLPYSPDLAPSDHFLFRNLKKFLRVRRFPDDNAVKSCNRVIWHRRCFSFSEGILSLEAKCVTIRETKLKNNDTSFVIRFNFHAQVDNLLNAPRMIFFFLVPLHSIHLKMWIHFLSLFSDQ